MDSTDFVVDPVECFVKEITSVPPLSPEDETFVVRVFREGGSGSAEAGRALVETNFAAVVSVARRYCDSGKGDQGTLLLDVIAAGNVALGDALNTFAGSGSERFWDHAGPQVEVAIQKAVGQ